MVGILIIVGRIVNKKATTVDFLSTPFIGSCMNNNYLSIDTLKKVVEQFCVSDAFRRWSGSFHLCWHITHLFKNILNIYVIYFII